MWHPLGPAHAVPPPTPLCPRDARRKAKSAPPCALADPPRSALSPLMWKPLAATLSLALSVPLLANPGHETTIAELNAQIAQLPDLPELYFQRAWNYREINRLADARADWETTLRLQPSFLPASRELARADADAGNPQAAITRLRQALAAAPPSQAFHRPGCHSLLAELLLRLHQNTTALAEARAGLAASPDLLLDLCLLRSEAQRRLGLLDERVADLAAASAKLRSFIIKTKWLDAMIDANRGPEILPEIELELANTRYQASWLIRRARIHLLSSPPTAAADLAAALREINSRLQPDQPDPSLLCERGLISCLQGQPAAADLALAQRHGADFWMTLPLAALLPATPSLLENRPSSK